MYSTNKDYISSVLESVKANSLASKISNIDDKILPRRYTTYQEPLKDVGSSISNISNVKDKVDTIHKPYFASVVHEKPQKTIIKIKEMRNEVSVNGAAVTIPMEAVVSVNACFVNTLYGYFIGDRLAFPLVENYVKNTWANEYYLEKNEIKRLSVWGKMHHIAIVAYFDVGLSIISTQIGKPLIEKCPKLPKVTLNEKVIDDGFIEVKKKKTKTKKKSKKQVEGIRLNKPTINLQYRRVDKGKSYKINNRVANKESNNRGPIQVTTYNSFSALSGETDTNLKDEERVNAGYQIPIESQFVNDSDEDVDEPWCLLGDLNAPLFVEDTSMGSSSLDVTMREFKECVKNIEVMDVQRMGLHYTWNQKPKGKDGILCKLDRVLANLEFLDVFMGAHAVFKPYRISDHSPAVLSIPSLVKEKPMPFKFFNVMVKKLKGLKKPIRKLMYDKGNLHANVVRLWEELDKVQTELDSDPNNLSFWEKEAAKLVDFNEALLMEEKFLKQKAKITWLKEGDSNTAYFHKVVKSRVSWSRIDVVTDAYGNVHHSIEVAKAFINHYEIFLREPGPDGFTVAFFKDTWDIIGVDVIKPVKEFFINGRLLKELNHTIIALIPKVNNPTRVTDYRPILCCNVLFKCISKIIANRLKDSLKTLVSPNQSAFMPGRCISDNILLTQEIMHNYHLDRGVPRINGSLHGYFEEKRGLRQGDPLSPYLFTLIMEVFTLMLKRRVREASNFTYHRFCSELDLINLCFPDDLFLFAHGDVNSAKVIKDALDYFMDSSGLNHSMPKSNAYFYNVINYTKLAILNVLPFEEDHLLVKYLGKNKSLLIARRLQLIQSVLSSLHVYWASVFMLPSRVLLDIEQIMRGFLWSQNNMSRGKVKVAWDVVCLPKQEGSLGIRRLDHFNKALMVSHVWKLLSIKESLWDKWIHIYKLKNRSFWDIPYRDRLLCGLISGVLRVLYPTSFHHVTLPELVLTMLPRDGMGKPFSVHNVWDSICPRDNLIAGLEGAGPSLASIITHLMPIAKRKSSKSCICKIVVAMAAYFVWHECNSWLFNKVKRSVTKVVECILSNVRLKLLSCCFKKSKDAILFARLWEIPMLGARVYASWKLQGDVEELWDELTKVEASKKM
uniref:Reverse transcriptase domain-containing protein n=1 Tax=Tanacetum cinerariifolium TaxID=118510 RepID=A0A6L2KMT6_TANCI|nr:hypothetical protein [Tanacetum cinerariifolium]